MDDALGLCAVRTDSEEKQVNEHFDKVAVGYPPPLVLNVEANSHTLRFLEPVITIDHYWQAALLFIELCSSQHR